MLARLRATASSRPMGPAPIRATSKGMGELYVLWGELSVVSSGSSEFGFWSSKFDVRSSELLLAGGCNSLGEKVVLGVLCSGDACVAVHFDIDEEGDAGVASTGWEGGACRVRALAARARRAG